MQAVRTNIATFLFILSASALASIAQAHGLVHEQIAEVSEQLEQKENRNNVSLYIRRGRFYIEDEELRLAKRDFKKALKLGKKADNEAHAVDAHYYLGEIAIRQKKYTTAIKQAQKFIQQLPAESGSHMRGQHLLGRAYFAARKFDKAVDAFQTTIDVAVFPKPEFYLELSKSFEALKQPSSAIDALEQGKQKRGNLSVFDDEITDIYIRQENYDLALSHLETMLAYKQRMPFLLIKKSEVLLKSKKPGEAKEVLKSAQTEINNLPQTRRSTPALEALAQDIEKRIREIP